MDKAHAYAICVSFGKAHMGKICRLPGKRGQLIVLTRVSFSIHRYEEAAAYGCVDGEMVILIDWLPASENKRFVHDRQALPTQLCKSYRRLKIYFKRGDGSFSRVFRSRERCHKRRTR